MKTLWAVYRQDFSGGKFSVGVNGIFTARDGHTIKVWDLESESAAREAAQCIDDSHYHHHKADYYPVSYPEGRIHEIFAREHIQLMT